MLDVLQLIVGLAFTAVVGYFVFISGELISDKKMRRRMGITDYYDNPIKKDNDEEQKS